MDIDVAATPLTNTPALRRLELARGASAEITVPWVDIPTLAVTPEVQAYDRLDPIDGVDRYRFRTPAIRGLILSVDPDGLVRDYEGFAVRVTRRGAPPPEALDA